MNWDGLRHLVLVVGHAVPFRMDRLDSDEGWFLKPFQAGEGPFYVEHVRAGVHLAAADPEALLVFAGGQTDRAAGARSEAQGYREIADHYGWEGFAGVAARATTEEFSLDSFLNLLYGLCRFRECTGTYPRRVTVAGWRFKQARFDFHRQTLRYPADCYRYEGVNDPRELAKAAHFEALRLADFREDPFGHSPALQEKRAQRNPFRRQHGYGASCPEVVGLLRHEGPEPYPERLPWE